MISKIKAMYKDFRRGLSIIFGKPKKGEGDRRLGKMALITEGQISVLSKPTVRTRVIKAIESDLKRAARKGRVEVEALIQNALDTPEYMHLLRRLGLEESHIRVMSMAALKKEAKRNAK